MDSVRPAMAEIDIVIHLAARAHIMDDKSADPLEAYRQINVDGTRTLAEAASAAGVKRFVFLSSIKVNGEQTFEKPYSAGDIPAPEDAYGISKAEAEQCLNHTAGRSDLEIAIIRTPLVYGPGVRANFLSLMSLANSSLPLPFGAITNNRRSLIYIENLVSILLASAENSAANGQIFLVRDGEDLSTTDLLRQLRRALNRPERLIAFPPSLLRAMLMVLGKGNIANRLLGSLAINDQATKELMNWTPPFSVSEGLKHTADWYLSNKDSC